MAITSLPHVIKKKQQKTNPQNRPKKQTYFFFKIAFTANRRVLLAV